MTPEGALQKTILDWLAAKRIMAFRMNTGAVKTDKRFFRFGVPGMADILAFPDYGDTSGVMWIEVKAGTKQSELQKSFQQQVEAAGHRYILARDLDAVIEEIGG